MLDQAIKLLSFVLVVLSLVGCANSPVTGVLYTGVTHSGATSGGILDNDVKILKTGVSSCTSILGIIAYGDCSDEAARANGGITKVNSVSHKTTSIYVFFNHYETFVTGE